jgi:photosystem II stability/assembly factor-like uncharacterized protein
MRVHARNFLRSLIFAACLSAFASARASAASGWTAQSVGTMAWLHAVSFIDARRGFAAGGRGTLLSTADGGAHWQILKRPTEDNLRDIFFVDEKTGWLVCERNIFQGTDEARTYLLKTTDGGATWTPVQIGAGAMNASLVRIVFADALHGWTFGELGALFATEDGGATWKRQPLPTRFLILGGAFSSEFQGALVGANQTLLFTEDGGANWRASRLRLSADEAAGAAKSDVAAKNSFAEQNLRSRAQPRLNAVSFADPHNGWAVGGGGAILTTVDGGRVWYKQRSGVDADLLDVKFVDAREGWAVGADGVILHTTDGGANWEAEASGTNHALERIAFVSDGAAQRGFIVGFGGTILTYNSANENRPALK